MLTIGISGEEGVGKTTLIDRLCIELENEFLVSVLPDKFEFTQIDSTHRYYERAINSPYFNVADEETVNHLLLVKGNFPYYEQWMSKADIRDLIHVVSLDQNIVDQPLSLDLRDHVGLVVVNKLDLLNLRANQFAQYCLRLQMIRGLRPIVFCSMRTGFGLDLIVLYIKQRMVMNRITNKYYHH